MQIKYTAFYDDKSAEIIALGAEINLAGKSKRAAVAFQIIPPSKTDIEKAAKELKRWAKFQKKKHEHEKRTYLQTFKD